MENPGVGDLGQFPYNAIEPRRRWECHDCGTARPQIVEMCRDGACGPRRIKMLYQPHAEHDIVEAVGLRHFEDVNQADRDTFVAGIAAPE